MTDKTGQPAVDHRRVREVALELATGASATEGLDHIIKRAAAYASFLAGGVMADNAAAPNGQALNAHKHTGAATGGDTGAPLSDYQPADLFAAASRRIRALATLERQRDANTLAPTEAEMKGIGELTLNGVKIADLIKVDLNQPLYMQMMGRAKRPEKIDISAAFTRPTSRFSMADLADMASALHSPDLDWPDLREGDIVRCVDAQGVSHLEHGTCYLVTERREHGVELDREPGMTAGPYHLRRFEIVSRPLKPGDQIIVNRAGIDKPAVYVGLNAASGDATYKRAECFFSESAKFANVRRADGEPVIESGTYECISKPSEARIKAKASAEVWRQMQAAKPAPAAAASAEFIPAFRADDVVEVVKSYPGANVGDLRTVTIYRPSIIPSTGFVVFTTDARSLGIPAGHFKLIARPLQLRDRVRWYKHDGVLTVDKVEQRYEAGLRTITASNPRGALLGEVETTVADVERYFTHEDGTPTAAPPREIRVTDDADQFAPIPTSLAGVVAQAEPDQPTGVTETRIGARPLSNENLKALAEAVYGDRRHSTRELVRLQEGVHLAGPEQVNRALDAVRAKAQAAFAVRGAH